MMAHNPRWLVVVCVFLYMLLSEDHVLFTKRGHVGSSLQPQRGFKGVLAVKTWNLVYINLEVNVGIWHLVIKIRLC